MRLKIIRTEADYEPALSEIEALVELDPDVGSPDAERLGLLTLLVEDYETKTFQATLPDPVTAIKFRMEQQNLTQRDLVPLIGSRSKVSEVLSRKRSLTMSMIRALHSRLGIPAKVLIQEGGSSEIVEGEQDWTCFPMREMIARGWIKENITNVAEQAEEVMRRFFSQIDSEAKFAPLYRITEHIRSARPMDTYALKVWTARVMILAQKNPSPVDYRPGVLSIDFMREVARASSQYNGPLVARDILRDRGISLIVEQQLHHTYLDGAAIAAEQRNPIIALTLRYDRIDNFWFTLMHELAHLIIHVKGHVREFFDDLELEDKIDQYEHEADDLAGEALIPHEDWVKSPASRLRSPQAAEHLARKLGIHSAIVAGRMRREFKAYRLLSDMVGHHQVRRLFPEVAWEK